MPKAVEKYLATKPVEVEMLEETQRGEQGFGSTEMDADLVEIYAIDSMPTATQEQLEAMIPPEYHDFLDVFDPEGPMSQPPPSRPQYDCEIKLDPSKPLPKPA